MLRTPPESPSASRSAPGGSRPTHPVLYLCLSSGPVRWHAELIPTSQRAIGGSHDPQSPRSLCAGALALRHRTPPAPIPRAREPHSGTHGHAPHRWSCPRAPSVAPTPLAEPYLSYVPRKNAASIHGAPDRPLRPRYPPRRGDSGRFEFTTARPVPNLPPPGSQRHVTTGAAEGQSWLGGRGLGAERARSPALLCSQDAPRGRPPAPLP